MPLQQLHGDVARRRFAQLGAEVVTHARVTALRPRGSGWLIATKDGTEHAADRVVLAVPPDVAEHLLPAGSVALPEGWAARLGSSPIVNVHVVYDRPVLDRPFLAAVDSPVQWVFDRTEPAGLRGGPQYLAVSLSAAVDAVTRQQGRRVGQVRAGVDVRPRPSTDLGRAGEHDRREQHRGGVQAEHRGDDRCHHEHRWPWPFLSGSLPRTLFPSGPVPMVRRIRAVPLRHRGPAWSASWQR